MKFPVKIPAERGREIKYEEAKNHLRREARG